MALHRRHRRSSSRTSWPVNTVIDGDLRAWKGQIPTNSRPVLLEHHVARRTTSTMSGAAP